MNANEKTLNTFATRVRQMILQYEDIKKREQTSCMIWWTAVKRDSKARAQLKQRKATIIH